MVTDLTHYLYSNNMLRYIEGYVQKVNPAKAPQVVGGLLDAEAPDDFVNNLILSVRSLIPVEQLCDEVRRLCPSIEKLPTCHSADLSSSACTLFLWRASGLNALYRSPQGIAAGVCCILFVTRKQSPDLFAGVVTG